jgi:hypothetical protein
LRKPLLQPECTNGGADLDHENALSDACRGLTCLAAIRRLLA